MTSLPLLKNAGRVDETIKLILIWNFFSSFESKRSQGSLTYPDSLGNEAKLKLLYILSKHPRSQSKWSFNDNSWETLISIIADKHWQCELYFKASSKSVKFCKQKKPRLFCLPWLLGQWNINKTYPYFLQHPGNQNKPSFNNKSYLQQTCHYTEKLNSIKLVWN